MAAFEYRQATEIANAFARHGCRYPSHIIRSKAATGRQKDRESLPRLESFREYLRSKGRV